MLDNPAAHKMQAIRNFLEQNPSACFHFTPTYSSWLNQVVIWFAKIQRDVIARGVVYLGRRFLTQADEIHSRVRQTGPAAPLGLHGSCAPHRDTEMNETLRYLWDIAIAGMTSSCSSIDSRSKARWNEQCLPSRKRMTWM